MKKTRSIVRQLALYSVIFGVSACGADSCSCDGFVAKDFPVDKVDKTIPTSGEIRVTSSGLTFLSDNLPAIVSSLLPGGLSFCVPPTSQSGLNICNDGSQCSSGGPGCDMSMTIDDASITPVPSDTLDVSITIGGLDETLPVRVLGSNCLLTIYSKADNNQPAQIDGNIPITFSVDSSSPFNDTRIEVGDASVDASDVDFDIDPVNFLDFLVCEGIDAVAAIGFVRDLALSLLTDQFVPLIQEQIDGQLCQQCDAGCAAGTTCDGNNICRYPDESCPQVPLGLSGELQIGSVLADFTEEPDAAIDVTVRAADHAVVDTGLTLGLRSGYDPVDEAICIPLDPTARDFIATPISPTVSGNATHLGQPFHFGIGYHKKAIEHMLWSVWGSGATCLKIGTSNIDLLTTGALGALVPSMKQLAYYKTSEAYIKIVPQKPPKVILGANDITPSGTSYTVNDPLMTIDWKDFDVHIYAYVQDRFTRIVTIRMDLLLPIALASDGMGGILPIIGDLDAAFQNERIIGGELVAEDPARILDLLPTLIGFALPSLTGSLSQPIAIPEFFGFRIDIGPDDITSVDNNTSIAIFADLVVTGAPLVQRTETMITNTEIDFSGRMKSGLIKPVVHLDVLPTQGLLSLEEQQPIEYSYRVNKGNWSLFDRTNRLAVDSPMLVLPGEHTIEVRSRIVGEPASVDPTPAVTTVMIDWEAPTVEIERRDAMLEFETSDLVDPDNLELRYKVIDGQNPSSWSAWAPVASMDLTKMDVPERFRLDVEVRDRAGNIGKDTQTVTWRHALEPSSTDSQPTGNQPAAAPQGCNSTGGSTPADLGWLLLVALGLAATRRRKIRFEVLALTAVLSVGACKCEDDPTDEGVCDPACAEGQQCVDGACVAEPQCTTGDDCAAGEECIAGECVHQPTCEDLCDCADDEQAVCDENDQCGCIPYCDKGCDDGEYCCYESNSCEALPDPCSETMCEVGFGPVSTSDASADLATCEITAGQCECQELPPLPIGWHGHYAAIARNAGTTAIAAYNSTYEDLMVGTIDAALNIDWQFVDGVPATGDVEGSLNGPRGGISDKGDDVGRYTALAIDDAGVLHVFYRDQDRGVLKYARGTAGGTGYSWDISDLDTSGDVGYWSSAAHLDGRVHLVYTVKAVDGGGGWMTELHHLSFDATGMPTDASATNVTIASDAADHPCGADCEVRGEECIASIGQCVEPTSDCAAACADGSACYQGVCELVHLEPKVGYLRAVGTNAQLSVAGSGLLVVYYDYMQNSVAWSRWDGAAWAMPTLVGAGTGPWASGMVDASDNVHLAYMDNTSAVPQLTYMDVTNGTTETVQDGIRDTTDWWMINDIGEDVDLRVATDGTITLVYQDATDHSLRIATRPPAGTWTVSELATTGTPYTGAHGFYAAMLRLPEAQLAVELVINNQLDPTEAAPGLHE